jgi:hypothetical protein
VRNGRASEEDERRIASAVATHRIAPGRAAFYRARALAGEDISLLDALQPCALNASSAGTRSGPTLEDDEAVYSSLFPSVEEGRRAADAALAAAVYDPASDKELFERLFGEGTFE